MLKYSKGLILNFIIVTLYFLALQFIVTVIARYSRDIGIDVVKTGIIWSSLFLVSLILRPIAGYVADKTSSYLAMSIGALFLAISSLVYMYSKDFNVLLVGRLIQGAGNGFFVSPSITAVAIIAGKYAGMALGLRSMIISMTGIVAPPIAGAITDLLGYTPVFTITLVLALITSTICGIAFKYEVKTADSNVINTRSTAKWRDAINLIVMLSFLITIIGGGIFSSLSGILQAHYRDIGYEAKIYGYFMMMFGLSSTVSRFLAGKLVSKKHPAKIAIVGYVLISSSMIILYYNYYIPWSYISAIVYGIGIGLTVPTLQFLVISSVDKSVANRAMSIYAMGFDIGGLIMPLLLSHAASLYGYSYVYFYLSILPFVAVGALMIILYYQKQ